jgi:hypothetical protein
MPPQFPPLTPTVRTLVVILGVFFLGQTLAEGLAGIPLRDWAALSPGLRIDLAWQWATYWLVAIIQTPGDVFWHLVSIFVLYWCLSTFELEEGRRRLLQLIPVGVIGAAIPLIVGGALLPDHFGMTGGPSPIFYAWVGALPVLRPGVKMGLWIATIPPINAWTLTFLMLGLTALQTAWTHDLAPLVEAIGAIGAGVLWARFVSAPRKTGKPTPPPKKRPGRPNLTVIEGGGESDDKPRWLN